ncbi:MAG: fumarylacetoacetate hydrolase family protein [Burkholderiaceae bacterium]
MAKWIRCERGGAAAFGELTGEHVALHRGDLFGAHEPTGESVPLADVRVLTPCVPSKFIGLWNNDRPNAEKQGLAHPAHPLYFIKPASSYRAHGEGIHAPPWYDGRVIYEGELGLVIGQRCSPASEAEAAAAIFGVTCINDVTALDLLHADASFAQWTRAKGMDGFGVFGPVIATGLDITTLSVRTRVNGRERQNFACSGMIFSAAQIVSALSRDMTLEPGDVIACGTSLGVLPMRAGTDIEVEIDGVGVLKNTYLGPRGDTALAVQSAASSN